MWVAVTINTDMIYWENMEGASLERKESSVVIWREREGGDRFLRIMLSYRSEVKVYAWDSFEMKDERNFCHRGRYQSSKVTRSRCTVGATRVPPARTSPEYSFPFISPVSLPWHECIHRQSCIFVRRAAAFILSATSLSLIQMSLFSCCFPLFFFCREQERHINHL